MASSVGSQAAGGRSLFNFPTAEARWKQRVEEAAQPLSEDAVGEAVDETVIEAVADGQPRGEEGRRRVSVQPGALQDEVEDVRQPQQVEDAGDAEQHHGVASVRAALAPLARTALRLRAEAGVASGDLPGVLPADPEDAPVGEADGERRRRVEQRHDEDAERRVGAPRLGAPPEHVAVVARLPPAEEGRQENQGGVNPDQDDAQPQPARRHQGGVGQRPGDGDVAVHADARQGGHGDALQHRDDVAEGFAGELLVEASEVVKEGQRGQQAADAHQQVGVRHGLDEVTGAVVVQQRGAVEDRDHQQVPSDDEHREEEDGGHLQHAGIQAAGVTHSSQLAEQRRTALVPAGGGVHVGGTKGQVQLHAAVIPSLKSHPLNPKPVRVVCRSGNKPGPPCCLNQPLSSQQQLNA